MNRGLYENWQPTTIGEICNKVTDGSHNPPKHNPDEKNVMLSSKNIQEFGVTFDNPRLISDENFVKENKRTDVHPGDILLTIVGTIGRTCVVPEGLQKFTLQRSVAVLKTGSEVNPHFLCYGLKAPSLRNAIIDGAKGAAQKGIYLRSVKALALHLPPMEEQDRIVAKLNSLFERIDKSIALLEENIHHTESIMPSALNEVFEGLDCAKDKIKNLSHKIQYGYTGKTKESGSFFYLRITDIQNGLVDWNQTPYSDISDQDSHKYELNRGDILFARTGATAGKSYLFYDEEKSIFASYLIRVSTDRDKIIPDYLYWFFQSQDYWNQIFGNIVGAAQPNFNGKKLGELILPVPELQVQKECIKQFKELDKVSRKLIAEQQNKLTNLKALKSSLLEAAFKGEL
jgi:type I restriction enzyme, S subunit